MLQVVGNVGALVRRAKGTSSVLSLIEELERLGNWGVNAEESINITLHVVEENGVPIGKIIYNPKGPRYLTGRLDLVNGEWVAY